jgi:hypothetical protein
LDEKTKSEGRNDMKIKKPRRGMATLFQQLEERTLLSTVYVVPLAATTNATHFHSLSAAIAAISPGDTVQLEPGSPATGGGVTINMAMTLQGDPNTPPNINAPLSVTVAASNVTLFNLNLTSVTINQGVNHLNLTDSNVGTVSENIASTGNGNNTFIRDQFSNYIALQGNTDGSATNDTITQSTFTSTATTIISVANSNTVTISDVNIQGAGDGQFGINVTNSQNVTINNNTIALDGASTGIFTQAITGGFTSPTTSASITNNTIKTFSKGLGIDVESYPSGGSASIKIEGNDFHGNLNGVKIGNGGNGVQAGTLVVDLGGGTLGSLGGNNFRSFTGTPSGSYAISDVATGSTATIAAELNTFGENITPANVIRDSTHGSGGAGTVDVSNALDTNHAFIQSLYGLYLGRAGAMSELNGWVADLANPAISRGGVIAQIARSPEAYKMILEGYYQKYLHRASDTTGLDEFLTDLQNGVTLEQVQAGFLGSQEYASRLNIDYTQSLYIQVLGRTGSTAELDAYNSAHLDRTVEATEFVTSAEYRGIVVTGYYQQLLHRSPSPSEVAGWVNSGLDLYSIELQFAAADEFVLNG